MWEIEGTDEFAVWYGTLSDDEQESVDKAVEVLERIGPALGRDLVDTIKTSRHPNMKELRPPGGSLRVLFIFDPRRTAILLLGGDKARRWNAWYKEAIPRRRPLRCLSGGTAAGGNTMSGHHKWSEIRSNHPARRERVEAWARAYIDALTLAELRERQGMTQDEVARALEVSQANVSKIERRDDIYLTTLRRYVEALGGTVRVSAVFDGEEVPLAVLGRDDAAAPVGR